MIAREHELLAPHTTFHIGGPARFFIRAENNADLIAAAQFAKEKSLRLIPLGSGSNILVADAGVDAVVVQTPRSEIIFNEEDGAVILSASVGTSWEEIIDAAASPGLWGIENLAGIPGTLGGAVVQNIGAYGAELAKVFAWAEVLDAETGIVRRISTREAQFAYRDSIFKHNRALVILRAGLRLVRNSVPNLSYPDLAHAMLSTPTEIARAVRSIRSKKFPDLTNEGTAGSFFKNPVISRPFANSLAQKYPGLPHFPQANGEVKVSLAWLLDHTLSLKGYAEGRVRLYEHQPLVIVAAPGATAREVEMLAEEVAHRVEEQLKIKIEREVETIK